MKMRGRSNSKGRASQKSRRPVQRRRPQKPASSPHYAYRQAVKRARSTRSVKRVPHGQLWPGRIVEVWVPYSEGEDFKRRPAVVLYAEKYSVTVVPVTSRSSRQDHPHYMPLQGWNHEGFSRESYAMLDRVMDVPTTDVVGLVGQVDEEDWGNLCTELPGLLGNQ